MQKHNLFNGLSKRLAALFSGLTLLFASGCNSETSQTQSSVETKPVTGKFYVTALNVGKADAFVLQTANTVTVLDAGNKGDGKYIDKLLAAQGIDKIDTLIITHFDKDHVGGAARLVNRLKVGTIYLPDYTSESDEYNDFMEKVNEKGITPDVLTAHTKKSWTDDDVTYQIFAAEQTGYGKNEENDFSICLYAAHGENTYFFSGDAESARQTEIMQLGLGQVDFLKFPYHGNYLQTTEAFLDKFAPKITVVTCSQKEYADPSTVETLQKRGIETYYLCDSGDVTFISDGKTITTGDPPTGSGSAADSGDDAE